MREFLNKYWKSIIFNVAETAIIFFSGWLLLCSWERALAIMVSFAIVKIIIGKSLHYKSWVKCLFMSYIVLLVLFFVANVNFPIALLLSIFSAIILTKHCNISEIYQFAWNKERKHHEQQTFVRINDPEHPVIKELEKLIVEKEDNDIMLVYKYLWVEGRGYKYLQDLLDTDSSNISRLSDRINDLFSVATTRHLTEMYKK